MSGKKEEREPQEEEEEVHIYPLHEAVSSDDIQTLKILLEIIAHPEKAKELKKTLPSSATKKNESEKVEKPEKKEEEEGEEEEEEEPVDLNGVNEEGVTALALAVREAKVEGLKLLIQAGAEYQQANEAGLTPLQEAVSSGAEELIPCITILCDSGADVNVRDPYTGTPPLWDAVANGMVEVARILIEHGADVFCGNSVNVVVLANNYLESPEGETLLFAAVANEAKELVEILLSKGVNANRQNLEGFTALHVAAYSNQPEMLKFLLEKTDAGRVSLMLKNEQGNTPKMEAEMAGNEECVQILEEYEKSETMRRNAKNPYYSPEGKDYFSQLDRAVIFNVLEKLSDPKDLCAVEGVCKYLYKICREEQEEGKENEKEHEQEGKEVQRKGRNLWKDLFVAWFGEESKHGVKKPRGVVYGQGRPFFAIKIFMEGRWKDCFEERFFINSCDPCTNHKIDLQLRLHFVAANLLSSDVTHALEQVLLFEPGTFEHMRYGGTALYAGRKRTVVFPTPFKRTETSEQELPSPDSLPHKILICIDLERLSPVEVMLDEFMAKCPKLLVGIKEKRNTSFREHPLIKDAEKKYGCEYVECTLSADHQEQVKQVFTHVIGSL